MENNIRIVRLKNGEDIVGFVNGHDNDYDITEPMSVDVEFRGRESGLVMRHWLPVQLIKKNEITIKMADVLCVFEPADEFCEYYENTVKKLRELLNAKNLVDNMDDEEVNNIMDAFEEMGTNTVIH